MSLIVRTAADLAAEALARKMGDLAAYRWQRETGGVECPSGAVLFTTRESQAQMTSTLVAMREELIPVAVPWKAQNGWYLMGIEDMRTASATVAAHIARCFAAEQIVAAQVIADPTIDVPAAFEAAYQGLLA